MFLYECVYSISFYGAVAEQNKLKSLVLERKKKKKKERIKLVITYLRYKKQSQPKNLNY
jgi:hypothetical protein